MLSTRIYLAKAQAKIVKCHGNWSFIDTQQTDQVKSSSLWQGTNISPLSVTDGCEEE